MQITILSPFQLSLLLGLSELASSWNKFKSKQDFQNNIEMNKIYF